MTTIEKMAYAAQIMTAERADRAAGRRPSIIRQRVLDVLEAEIAAETKA